MRATIDFAYLPVRLSAAAAGVFLGSIICNELLFLLLLLLRGLLLDQQCAVDFAQILADADQIRQDAGNHEVIDDGGCFCTIIGSWLLSCRVWTAMHCRRRIGIGRPTGNDCRGGGGPGHCQQTIGCLVDFLIHAAAARDYRVESADQDHTHTNIDGHTRTE